MKKFLAIILALVMVLSFAACGKKDPKPAEVDPNAKDQGVLTHSEFIAAADGTDVTIEGFITAFIHQDSWGNSCNLMLQDGDGAYFVYKLEYEDSVAGKLEVGQKVKVSGIRTAWAGENEIKEKTGTVEILDGTYTFDYKDVTEFFGKDEITDYQNMKVKISGAKVVSPALYKWDGSGEKGDDLYITFEINGSEYQFLVETDLFGADSDVYKAVEALTVGQTVDLEGFLYWYNTPQMWIVNVTVK
ncbi:MAG: hypothetical protein IJI56_01525 [Firmicutes bacterium]|nr:hypothetical protein [Bacillota bacterium]